MPKRMKLSKYASKPLNIKAVQGPTVVYRVTQGVLDHYIDRGVATMGVLYALSDAGATPGVSKRMVGRALKELQDAPPGTTITLGKETAVSPEKAKANGKPEDTASAHERDEGPDAPEGRSDLEAVKGDIRSLEARMSTLEATVDKLSDMLGAETWAGEVKDMAGFQKDLRDDVRIIVAGLDVITDKLHEPK